MSIRVRLDEDDYRTLVSGGEVVTEGMGSGFNQEEVRMILADIGLDQMLEAIFEQLPTRPPAEIESVKKVLSIAMNGRVLNP